MDGLLHPMIDGLLDLRPVIFQTLRVVSSAMADDLRPRICRKVTGDSHGVMDLTRYCWTFIACNEQKTIAIVRGALNCNPFRRPDSAGPADFSCLTFFLFPACSSAHPRFEKLSHLVPRSGLRSTT